MRALLAVALLAGCFSSPDPTPPAPPARPAPAAPVVVDGLTALDRLISRDNVAMVGTLDRRTTIAWGSLHDALTLDDGRVVALRLPRIDQTPESRTAAEAALRGAADALVGQRVAVVGDLHVPQGGEYTLSSVPEREGGSLDDPMVDTAVTLRPNQVVAAAGAPDFGVPDVSGVDALSAVLSAAPVRVRGTLRAATTAGGAPTLLVELADQTLLGAEVPAASADAARALVGQTVVLDGRLKVAAERAPTIETPTGPQRRDLRFAVAVIRFEAE